jgi:hypothetical protein
MTMFPGTRLGPYEIQLAMGAGGMGEVGHRQVRSAMEHTLLRDTTVSADEVEAELQALASPGKNAVRNLTIALGSLLLFVSIGAVSSSRWGFSCWSQCSCFTSSDAWRR